MKKDLRTSLFGIGFTKHSRNRNVEQQENGIRNYDSQPVEEQLEDGWKFHELVEETNVYLDEYE